MRPGVLPIIAAFVLVVAGIVSTSIGMRGKDTVMGMPEDGELSTPGGSRFDHVDLGDSKVGEISVDGAGRPLLRWRERFDGYSPRPESGTVGISMRVVGGTLRVTAPSQYDWASSVSLRLPAGFETMQGHNLDLRPKQRMERLSLVAHGIEWIGAGAGELEFSDHASCGFEQKPGAPYFRFLGGEVDVLRVHLRRGQILLEITDEVERIELAVTPEVAIKASRHDLDRIVWIPPQAVEDGSVAMTRACVRARRDTDQGGSSPPDGTWGDAP